MIDLAPIKGVLLGHQPVATRARHPAYQGRIPTGFANHDVLKVM